MTSCHPFGDSRILVLLFLTSAIVSCSSGPAELSKIIPAKADREYQAHLQAQRGSAREAWLHWRAEETGQSAESLAAQDESMSQSKNPYRPDDPWAVGRGAIVYQAHCASCHGPNADGYAADGSRLAGRKDFHNSHVRMIAAMSEGYVAKWFRKIHAGSDSGKLDEQGLPRVMPAMKDQLTNQQIWLAITYLMSTQQMEGEVVQ